MPQWDADVEVTEELVRARLADQFPGLDASSARFLGEGWDNSVWLVEERWAFRFPRRAVAVPLVEQEVAVLPRVAPLLPVLVPVPVYLGRPDEAYPWPFFGAELLPGREPADAALAEGDRAALGADLGRFLRALHAAETRAVVDPDGLLPIDPNRRAEMPFRVERTREELAALGGAASGAERVLAAASVLPPSNELALCHGDLHLRHVLVQGDSLSGVIDWGDVCVADPAIDLVLYWSLLPPRGRSAFAEEYNPVSEERLLRARVLSLFLCAILTRYARDVGNAGLEREMLAGLGRTLVD